ncbi:hypothetical protein MJO28_001670 [Puccinia striiformis f. sp. tritici]|uniref:Uncharacterized protein n=1 Tax=Puccinia striiformis f. sp. tritici TaxID=168172 RepID=A0ACC0EUM2_9BASI|nr:hypothetical protein Pst134EA_003097 [Puccinia striiformis f. sp. tritici]KAH9472486.1 hypothetical protein Pst134EA_003097 [Puccinia striiformis f. sp. tritici]KAI7961181.1 hypothetical protein MJO28_001670 [Puccinia striiformis f. sp. tritici]KAI7965960.1 hypothetical protein MJO29_001708 [Puccinia striiformis f. sp. tritici]
MGRPRKYPRTEYFGDLSDSLPMELNSHAPTLQRGWNDSNLFMRTLQPHEYNGQGPPGNLAPATAPWRAYGETRGTAFNINPPENVLRRRPFMPTSGGLPLPPGHQSSLSTQNSRESDVVLLNQMLPGPSPATLLGSTVNLHHTSASQAEIARYYETDFLHSASSSRRISLEQDQMGPISRSLARGSTIFLDGDLANSRSPPSLLPHVTNALGDSHEVILTCNARNIFQHFKGTTIHVTTQAHLQFILREYPNPYSPVPPHKHPSVLSPSFYYTMLADVVSWIVSGQASVSDRQDDSLNTREPLFTQMLNFDRGENKYERSMTTAGEGVNNPLKQFSSDELNSIYSRWLSANPFAFLFNDAAPGQQSIHLAENDAFLATVVGWHFYLRSRSRNYDPSQIPNHHPLDISARCYMPFFEFAEAELMGRAMCVNRLTLSTVQGLVLLGAFRSVDSQPRCGWALLSVAHLLAKEYLSPTNGLKRPRNASGELDVQENKILGMNWLMCLYKSWTLLSMKFSKFKVHAMVDGSPSYLDAYWSHARVNSTAVDVQANTEWANRTLLNVSQILEVFSTLCQEDPSHSLLPDPMSTLPSNDRLYKSQLYLIRWLMDTAKMRCQIMGSYDSPPYTSNRDTSRTSGEIRNAHVNTILAVVFSIFALSRLVSLEDFSATFSRIPHSIFRDVLKLLQIISTEGADSVVNCAPSLNSSSILGEALLLRIMRGLFPQLLILVSAFAKTMPDFSITSSSDSNDLLCQFLKVIASLARFASAGLSLYPLEDFQVIEDARIKVVPLSDNLPTSPQISSGQEKTWTCETPCSASFLGTAQIIPQHSQTRVHIAPEPFEDSIESVGTKRQRIATNTYPAEPINLIGSYLAPTQSSAPESTLTCNNGGHSFYPISSTEVGGISSSPLLSDPPSSTSYHLQPGYEPEANKAENGLIPPQGTELILPLSDSQGLIHANEMGEAELNSGAFVYPRGTDHYFCPLDSSWINQPPLDQNNLDSHSQNRGLDTFQRTRNLNPLSPPVVSPPSYRQNSPSLNNFPNHRELHEGSMREFLIPESTNRAFEPQELTEHSSGFQYDSFTRLGTPEPSVFTRLEP